MQWHTGGILLAALLVAFELTSVPLPFFGSFSSSWAVLGALCLIPQAGPQHAMLALGVALLLRTLLRQAWAQGLCDLASQGLGVAFLAAFVKPLGLVALLPAGALATGVRKALSQAVVSSRPASKVRTSWYAAQDWIWQHELAVLFLAPVMTVMVTADPLYAFWLLPTLGGLHRAVHAELLRLHLLDVEDLQEENKQSRRALQEVNTRLTMTRQTLKIQNLRESVLWDLSVQLAGSQGVKDTATLALRYLMGKLPCDSAAVIVMEGETPRIKAAYPPGGVRVTRLMHRAFREQRPITGDSAMTGEDQPYPGHFCVLALPLGQEGVLYCGRAQRGNFSQEEGVLLGTVAGQVALGLQAARRLEAHRHMLGNLLQSAKTAAVGQLAAGLAHELNTPLGAIALQMDLAIERRDKPERVQERLQAAQRSLEQAQKILKRLLYYSREGAVEDQSLDLGEVVQDTLDFLEGSFSQEGVRLVRNLEPMPPLVGNANQLQQALVNLLLNARDACLSAGAHEPTVSVRTSFQNGRRQIRVLDGGPGIPREIGDRIFEPFFTTRPVGQGVGLGLPVAQKIVQNHKGNLSGRNRPDGKGAEFVIEI